MCFFGSGVPFKYCKINENCMNIIILKNKCVIEREYKMVRPNMKDGDGTRWVKISQYESCKTKVFLKVFYMDREYQNASIHILRKASKLCLQAMGSYPFLPIISWKPPIFQRCLNEPKLEVLSFTTFENQMEIIIIWFLFFEIIRKDFFF